MTPAHGSLRTPIASIPSQPPTLPHSPRAGHSDLKIHLSGRGSHLGQFCPGHLSSFRPVPRPATLGSVRSRGIPSLKVGIPFQPRRQPVKRPRKRALPNPPISLSLPHGSGSHNNTSLRFLGYSRRRGLTQGRRDEAIENPQRTRQGVYTRPERLRGPCRPPSAGSSPALYPPNSRPLANDRRQSTPDYPAGRLAAWVPAAPRVGG